MLMRVFVPTLDFGCTMDEIYEDVTLEPVIDEPDGEPITKVV